MSTLAPIPEEGGLKQRKRRRVDRHGVLNQDAYLESLPCAARYECSYMHRETVTHAVVAPSTDFIATASQDGHLKFWKKMKKGVEFVKHYHAHVGAINAVAVSADGHWLCTTGVDGAAKLYDVTGFDMVCIIRTNKGADPYVPGAACWVHNITKGSPRARVAIAAADDRSPVRIYGAPTFGLLAILDVHNSPIVCMHYISAVDTVVSADVRGVIEYWRHDDDAGGSFDEDDDFVAKSKVELTRPTLPTDVVRFRHKVETDLFELAKKKAEPSVIEASRDGKRFSITAKDAQVRIFDFATGKMIRQFDESVSSLKTIRLEHAARKRELESAAASSKKSKKPTDAGTDDEGGSSGSDSDDDGPQPASADVPAPEPEKLDAWTEAVCGFEEMAYGRRSAVESELQSSMTAVDGSKPAYSRWNAVFDETGHFIIYAGLVGCKVVNVASEKVVALLSRSDEGERFVSVALFEGAAKIDAQMEQARAVANKEEAELTMGKEQDGGSSNSDPTVFATSFKRRRFYLTSRREPDLEAEDFVRDLQNEMPTAEDLLARLADANKANNTGLATEAVLRTTAGDIRFKLFPAECPKTVENFTVHAKKGYYDNHIFHRVIKQFMLQTGDPQGDGTGGESIWGGDFDDEFHPALKHDRPFTVSMANAGANSNGSQFFITTVPTPWLDNKHTVFGRVIDGMETCTSIENTRCNRFDKPFEDIKILSIDLK